MSAALRFGAQLIEPAQLERRAACAATGLERAGVADGDVVAVMLYNCPAYLEAMLACRRLGAYCCPINWHYKADEAAHILRDSGAKVLVIDPKLLEQVQAGIPESLSVVKTWEEWREQYPPWNGAPRTPRGSMPYTSGTTGRAKGVRRTPPDGAALRAITEVNTAYLGVRPGSRAFVSAPLYHSAPNLYAMHAALHAELLVLEERFDAEATLALIERHRVSDAYLVPTMYVRMLRLPAETRRRYDLSSLRFVCSTGSPCAPDVKRAMIDWLGPVITEFYASSETGGITFIDSRDWLAHPGSAGRPVGSAVVRILDERGRELPPGEIGLIYCRQPAYPDFSYNNNPAARAAIERDGLWSVGDMGYLDADGYLYVADRKSDMVISGGVNIYPAEIEAALMTLPGVADCAVFGVPDEEFGEALAAAVQPQSGKGFSEQQIKDYLKSRIAGYKVPRIVTFHEALPREDSGKIFKRLLREPYWRGAGRKI